MSEKLTKAELELAARALRLMAEQRKREAGGHRWSGQTWKSYRVMLRAEAAEAEALAVRLEAGS